MHQIQQNNSHDVDDNHHTYERFDIRSMPDPLDIYSSTLGASDTSQSFVHIPNVKDGDGNIILPQDYDLKLPDNAIVMMNVYLKLYVFYLILHKRIFFNSCPQRWLLRPNNHNNSSYARKDGDENGTRIYQMMLNSMQLLPFTDGYHINDPSSTGEKRKASNEAVAKSDSPKKKITKTTRTPKKVMPVRGSVGGPNQAKSLPKSSDLAMEIV